MKPAQVVSMIMMNKKKMSIKWRQMMQIPFKYIFQMNAHQMVA